MRLLWSVTRSYRGIAISFVSHFIFRSAMMSRKYETRVEKWRERSKSGEVQRTHVLVLWVANEQPRKLVCPLTRQQTFSLSQVKECSLSHITISSGLVGSSTGKIYAPVAASTTIMMAGTRATRHEEECLDHRIHSHSQLIPIPGTDTPWFGRVEGGRAERLRIVPMCLLSLTPSCTRYMD